MRLPAVSQRVTAEAVDDFGTDVGLVIASYGGVFKLREPWASCIEPFIWLKQPVKKGEVVVFDWCSKVGEIRGNYYHVPDPRTSPETEAWSKNYWAQLFPKPEPPKFLIGIAAIVLSPLILALVLLTLPAAAMLGLIYLLTSSPRPAHGASPRSPSP